LHITRTERDQLSEAGAVNDLINQDRRAWLLRLCTRLSRDLDIAEDLTQGTLIEAWRHWDRLRDPNQINPWLAGITRNVYRGRSRQRAREAARILPLKRYLCGGDPLGQVPDEDPLAFELELERQELATPLDRALSLLPPETRDLLIWHYIGESSHAGSPSASA
jgi:RNA polymerase sigma factor (sigma-70 family)